MKAIHSTQKTWDMCPRIMCMTFGTECTHVFNRRLWNQNELTNPTED